MSIYLIGTICLCILTSLLISCKPTKPLENEAQTPETKLTTSTETTKNSLPFPVYENFSDLAYLFEYQNDTTYVINFWATWCKPCVAELPYFEKLHANYSDKKVKVVLVSLDFAKDVPTKLVNFVKKRQLKPSVIALTDGKYNEWIDQVSPEWSGAIPVTYIYKEGKIAFHNQQYEDYQELEVAMKEVMD